MELAKINFPIDVNFAPFAHNMQFSYRPGRTSMRIRSRLLILVFSMLLPSIIGAGLGIYYVYHEQQQAYRESIEELANAMALLLDKEMSERVSTLQTLARSPTITDRNMEGFYRFAHEVASSWDTTIVLSDEAGQQLLNTRVPFGTKNLPPITPSLLEQRRLRGPNDPLVSDVYYAPIGKSHSFAVQVPVMRDGRLLYYVTMGSFAVKLQRLFEQQKMPPGWTGTILDHQGVVAARSHLAEKLVGVAADPGLRKKIAESTKGTNDGRTLDGVPVTAFFSRSPASGWSFVVSVPRDALHGAARDAALLISAIALLLLGLGVAAAFVIARKTAKSMEDLRLAAADLGQGKAVARQSSGLIEIDAVSLEMARASEKIGAAKAELEHRVAEAVAIAAQSQKALLQSQKLEALGRLTGGIAHDFNNLMQTLTTGLQLMLFSATDIRIRNTVEACQRAVARAAELTRQLMVFGRVQDAHLATVDLNRRMEEIKPLLVGGLRSDISLQVDVPNLLWPVTIDPTQFELALLNVVINARDAMPNGGSLIIRIENRTLRDSEDDLADGDYVAIAIIDSGTGMTQELASKALDPFFTTKPVGEGSGLGLPQAYGFARQMGGNLTIHSQVDRGTTITIYLPRAHGAVGVQPIPAREIVPEIANTGKKILFVEDDLLVSAVVGPALAAAGLKVVEARSGEEAMRALEKDGPFDAILSDIVMPGSVSGIDLAKYVREHAANTRIVLATGYSEHRLDMPGVEILAKPYDVKEAIDLLCRIEA